MIELPFDFEYTSNIINFLSSQNINPFIILPTAVWKLRIPTIVQKYYTLYSKTEENIKTKLLGLMFDQWLHHVVKNTVL